LKAALRRLDVRDADEFDEEEYRAASEAVRQQTQAIVQVGLLSAGTTVSGFEELVSLMRRSTGQPARRCGSRHRRSCRWGCC
jgi:hypothetical protein